MYPIIEIIYGVPITEKVNDILVKRPREEECHCGFTRLYSGTGPEILAGYCGVKLDTFDEFLGYNDPDELRMTPTPEEVTQAPEEVTQAKEKVAALDQELQEACLPIGTYFVWHSG